MTRATIVGLFAGGLTLAGLLAGLQMPFAAARFAYGEYREYEGELSRTPFPSLRTSAGVYPLVSEGKFSAERDVAGITGRVALRGALVERAGERMLEVERGSVRARTNGGLMAAAEGRVETAELRGEIVDSKCYLGVMNPGAGKTHRACAARCLHGGVPPALATPEGRLVWLQSKENLAPYAGDRVLLHGEFRENAGLRYFHIQNIRRQE